MTIYYKDYCITDHKDKMDIERIHRLLQDTYWAKERTIEQVKKSIEGSVVFGVFHEDVQVGFARVISDFATMYWLCDVIVDPAYRGQGIGRKLVDCIIKDTRFEKLSGILATRDAQKLYETFGFIVVDGKYMRKLVD